MDYQSRHPDERSPNFEHKPLPQHAWPRSDQPQPQQQQHSHSFVTTSGSIAATAAQILDPESEDSDVSVTEGDYGVISPFPVGLPQTPSKHQLDNAQTIAAHLNELTRVEDFNIKKHNRLKEKRTRKDERILQKRAIQDEKIKIIMDARQRRDAKTALRREREDIAFQRFYETLEEEEGRLRQRLKRLKRGLPPDDVAPHRDTLNAASSPAQTYSTVPPPAKRHQSAHPAHHDPYARPPESSSYSATPPHHPSYHFYPASGLAPLPPPPPPPPASSQLGLYQRSPPHHERSPRSPAMSYSRMDYRPPHRETLRQDDSPHTQARSINLHNDGSTSSLQRHSSSSYDTRPPPPTMSTGFASVNQPPHSGFAAVNARDLDTPPPPPKHRKRQRRDSDDRDLPLRNDEDDREEKEGSGKRTPSTTHPYQMSEAFANRHHHCERTDTINRGIWTWYGHGGTADRPTAQPTEMYLRCNHDGCGRIDWRTVHGLQCHIVKNHEQPKGTIGSLEKALERYGVPVRDVEALEEREGLGAGGTMADPKNQKARARNRESAAARRDAAANRDTPVTNEGRTSGHQKALRPEESYSPTYHSGESRSMTSRTSYPQVYDVRESPAAQAGELPGRLEDRSVGGFASINTRWPGTNADASKDEQSEPRLSEVPQHHHVDATQQSTLYAQQSQHTTQDPFWSSVQAPAEPPRAPTQGPSSSLTTPGTDSVPPAGSSVTSFPPSSTEQEVVDTSSNVDKQVPRTSESNTVHSEGGIDSGQGTVSKPSQLDMTPPKPHVELVPTPHDTSNDSAPVQSIEALPNKDLMVQDTDVRDAPANLESREQPPIPPSPVPKSVNRSNLTSPEALHKRTIPRRESRRSSIATPNRGSGADRENRRGYEEQTPTHTGTFMERAASATADDEDSIVVAVPPGLERQRDDGEDGDERTKVAPKKLPNGRVLRKLRA